MLGFGDTEGRNGTRQRYNRRGVGSPVQRTSLRASVSSEITRVEWGPRSRHSAEEWHSEQAASPDQESRSWDPKDTGACKSSYSQGSPALLKICLLTFSFLHLALRDDWRWQAPCRCTRAHNTGIHPLVGWSWRCWQTETAEFFYIPAHHYDRSPAEHDATSVKGPNEHEWHSRWWSCLNWKWALKRT